MKLCGVNVPFAFCHCSLPLEIPSSFALGENAQTAYHMLNCIVQNSKPLSKSRLPQHPLKQDQPYLFGTSIKKEIQYQIYPPNYTKKKEWTPIFAWMNKIFIQANESAERTIKKLALISKLFNLFFSQL